MGTQNSGLEHVHAHGENKELNGHAHHYLHLFLLLLQCCHELPYIFLGSALKVEGAHW
jgi:hypothetical protein